MDQEHRSEDERTSYWRDVEHRRRASVIGAVALGLVLVAGVIAWSVVAGDAAKREGDIPGVITPAEPTGEPTSSVSPTASLEPSASIAPTQGPGGSVKPAPTITPAAGRAPQVAYRRDGWLCVADEDGAGEVKVVRSASGVFALSPDAKSIALIDEDAGKLTIVTVATKAAKTVGGARQDRPSWAPDSSWLVYTDGGATPKVRRVNRDASAARPLFDGTLGSVGLDGATVVGAAPAGAAAEIVVWRDGAAVRVRAFDLVSGCATDGTNVYYGAGAFHGGPASLRAMRTDGTGERVLVGAPQAARAAAFTDLELAPDGSTLLFAEHGDDGYSRLFSLLPGAAPVSLCARRDCYPLRWGAEGATVLLIEGNSFQGETTALLSVRPDGTARRLLVEGADR